MALTMIYDRNIGDILRARRIVDQKIKAFQPLTAEEKESVRRAFFDCECLNRITGAISEIWAKIVARGGEATPSENVKKWKQGEIFTAANFEGLLTHIGTMIDACEEIGVTTMTLLGDYAKLNTQFRFTNLNAWEKLLVDIDAAVETIPAEADLATVGIAIAGVAIVGKS